MLSDIKGVFIVLSDGTHEPVDVGSKIVSVNEKGFKKLQKRQRNPKLNLELQREDLVEMYAVKDLYVLAEVFRWISLNKPEVLQEFEAQNKAK